MKQTTEADLPLVLAVTARDHERARALLAAGASPNAIKMEEDEHWHVYSETPVLYLACTQGDRAMVELLLDNGADPNLMLRRQGIVDREAIPCLIAALAHLDIVALLLARGADANLSRSWGEDCTTYYSPLWHAFSDHEGNKELADLLRRHGAQVNRS